MYLSLAERDGVKFVAIKAFVSGKLHQSLKNKQTKQEFKKSNK